MVWPLVRQTNSQPAWLGLLVGLCLLCNLPPAPLLVQKFQDLTLLGLGCGSSTCGPDVVEQLDHPVIRVGLRGARRQHHSFFLPGLKGTEVLYEHRIIGFKIPVFGMVVMGLF